MIEVHIPVAAALIRIDGKLGGRSRAELARRPVEYGAETVLKTGGFQVSRPSRCCERRTRAELSRRVVCSARSGRRDRCAGGSRARGAAEGLAREGNGVRYVRSSFLPQEEMWLLWCDAPTPALVGEAGRRAELDFARIVETVE